MRSIVEAAAAVPELAKAVYSDAVAGTLQQIGKIGEDAARTVRLALFPLQFTAALQDRLASYIDESVRKVPERRRTAPPQSLALEVCERLRRCEPGELVAQMYIELLARAMDKERIGEAHPAFVHVIAQLAPDEVALIHQLSETFSEEDDPTDHVYLRDENDIHRVLSRDEVACLLGEKTAIPEFARLIQHRCVQPERLAQPELFSVFLQHLQTLGLVEYANNPWSDSGWQVLRPAIAHVIRLTQFGRLFFKACVDG